MAELDKEWFELKDVRRRTYSKSVWIPVFGSIDFEKTLKYPDIGHIEDFLMIGAAVIFKGHIEAANELDWHYWTQDGCAPYLNGNGEFCAAGSFPSGHPEIYGFRLVLSQHLNSLHPRQVYLHPDFVLAYGLLKEGNLWLRPNSGYEEVAREIVDESGEVKLLEVRAEYLRDFLAAQNASFRLYYFRNRRAIFAERPSFDWPDDGVLSDDTHDRCNVDSRELNANGETPGSTWAFHKFWRTDVDPEEDVPEFTGQSEEDTDHETTEGARDDLGDRYMISGEMWRGEWIAPAPETTRMNYSEPQEDLFVTTDAGGEKVNLETLNHEEVGKYLWFKPEVVGALLSKRGSQLKWYTSETGGISPSPDSLLHFGVNKLSLVNTYAYDVARLPLWERQIWVAHNCRPDGGVSEELLKAQMECQVAKTEAPEILLSASTEWLDGVFKEKFERALLREHAEINDLVKRVHRFRVIDESSLLTLAKDLTKLTVERLQKTSLQEAVPDADKKLGSLKLLQKLLADCTDETYAYKRMTPLFGLYDLRLSDAHLSTSDIEESYKKLGIDRSAPLVKQAAKMIETVAHTIGVIGGEFHQHIKS